VSGLGHWNWIKLRGEQRQTLVILAYQCVPSTQTTNTV
jgi:hypothetical protein